MYIMPLNFRPFWYLKATHMVNNFRGNMANGHSRGGQVYCNELQDVGIRTSGVVESGRVNENEPAPRELENGRCLDTRGTRLQSVPHVEFRSTCQIDELSKCRCDF